MASTVVGLFDDRDDAHNAVQDLMAAGFSRDKISLVATDPSGEYQKYSVDAEGNLAGEGAAAGLTSGAVVGGLLGLLIGAGAIFFPPAGVLVAGPIAGLITGAAAGAATGGILGALIGLGIPKEHAETYAEGVRRGGTLITVTTDESEVQRVKDLLDRDGAVDIEQRGGYYRQQGFTGYDANSKPYTADQYANERDQLRSYASDETLSTGVGTAAGSGRVRTYAYADTPTGTLTSSNSQYDAAVTPTGAPNGVPGIQTGGHDADGSPDTRGITEKAADAITGDRIDDKTGKQV
jgi:hypothetical protein